MILSIQLARRHRPSPLGLLSQRSIDIFSPLANHFSVRCTTFSTPTSALHLRGKLDPLRGATSIP